MKKKWIWMLFCIILTFTACGQVHELPKEEQNKTEEMDPLMMDYLEGLELLASPVREYGESTGYLLMEEDLMVRVLYPVGEEKSLQQAIEDWIDQKVSEYQAEASGCYQQYQETAELTVEYDSYVIHEKLAGVKLTGVFDEPYIAHPIDVIATFNVNLESGELLTLEETLLPGGAQKLRDLVIEQTGVEEELADENLLRYWLLTPNGLEITLARGDYLPMSDGTRSLLFSYEELDGIFLLPQEPGQDSEQPGSQQEEPSQAPVEPSPGFGEIDPEKPMIALTFDDGPSAHTERLLDAFATHGGKGTFFVVGNMIDSRAATLQRMAAEGHEIGSHSWNHRQLTKLGEQELTDQIMNTRAKIYEITGVDTRILRPPYGSYNDQVKATSEQLGVVLVNWSVDTLDWKYKNADTVYQAVMKDARDGAIILCHDLHETTVDAMERAIPDLMAQGYQLVTVSELLETNGGEMTPGKVYLKR